MSVFRRGNRWAAKFVLRGQQHWVPGGPWATKTQAANAERHFRERLQARVTDETCASFAQRWLEDWPREAASTRQLYGQAAQRFGDHFGSTRLGEVERVSARAWALGVPRNISKIVGTLYEDARNVGLVESNPFSNLRLPKTEKTESVVCPSEDEFLALLRSCAILGGYGPEFRAMLTFASWTGLRAGEIHALQWEDFGAESIRVRRARKSDGTLGLPKNGKEREIALIEPARVLDQVPRRPDSFVFHTPRGQPLRKGNSYYHWNKVRAGVALDRSEAGGPTIRFHDLRHLCATRLLERGHSHFDVSVHLGHEDGGALVMARYGHPSKSAARDRLLQSFRDWPPQIGSEAVAVAQ